MGAPPERNSLFVGRDRELTALREALDSAVAGRGRLMLLVGDAGIGKTSLVEQLCAEADERGIRSWWGRCWEGGGAPPYFPWIEILRAYRRAERELGSDVVGATPELAQLLPELGKGAPASSSSDAEQVRFRLFESFVELLKRVSAGQAMVLVLDDLHWADAGSLLLLRFLSRELLSLPLLVVGTYRATEVRVDPNLSRQLGDLGRDSQRLLLGGLSATEVGLLVERLWRRPVGEDLAASLHRTTEGNPFFVDEVVRLLISQPDATPTGAVNLRIPDEVREAIRRRLAHLSNEAHHLLERAAIVGQQFDAAVLVRVGADPAADLIHPLEELQVAGVIVPVADSPGRYRFSHALVRQTLYESFSPSSRMALHHQVGDALAALFEGGSGHAAEIADHYLESVLARTTAAERAEDVHRAVAMGERAAAEALQKLAYEQAASFYERCLQALAHLPGADPAGLALSQCQLTLALGDAQRCAGELETARATFRDAARLARSLPGESAPFFGRAALGLGAATAETGARDDELIRTLEEALDRVGPEESPLRVAVLARLSRALYFTPAAARRVALSRAALELARRLDDSQATASALLTHHFASWGPGTHAARLDVAQELIQLAQHRGDRELELEARVWRITDGLESGHACDELIDQYARLAEDARLPRYRWLANVLLTARALYRQPLAEVEPQVHRTRALGQRVQIVNAEQFFFVQLLSLRGAQGRGAELREDVARLLARFPALEVWRTALAVIDVEGGRLDEARRVLVQLGQDGFAALPRDGNWLAAMARLSEVCLAVGDRQHGEILYDLLSPFSGAVIVIATGVAMLGSVAHYLGALAHLCGRASEAEYHFHSALAVHDRLGAPALAASTRMRFADLLAEGDTSSRERAELLRSEALTTAEHLGWTALLRQSKPANGVRAQPVADARVAAFVPTPTSEPTFRIDGDLWHLQFQSHSVRLKDTKGLRIVHHLLAHPNQRIPVAELTSISGGTSDASPEQLRVNITKTVNTALRRIAAEHPDLARHLSATIRTGQTCVYLAEQDAPTWCLD